MDTPWYREVLKKEHRVDQFPGLSCREVDMRAWNQGKPPLEKRQLYFYTPLGDVPPVSESPNFHAIAHLYASDRNSLYLIPNILEKGNDYTLMASLSINVVFNGVMKDTDVGRNALGRDRWFCQEAEVSWIGGGRGIHQSRIWSPEGNLVATTWQEGLVRFGKGEEYRKVEGKTSRL
ncbi:Thioesterase/thiol ester dehydrase-isomerase [Viridothelium virens]|uniref:Thioesterase/thiol ester dehydrase-isomerase n=1 Tax=Viridothelium virens TaxID=1048519 RepID=A0A6A6HFF6_VIRVR|nr:Thioesterase/thiol ester dehydrase-isomerase [Viridothelium virens]